MTFPKAKVGLCLLLIFCVFPLFSQESSAGDCTDGIDNDGDGLVDYYDDDCPCDGENFYGTCATACSATTFPSTTFSMAEQWRTDQTSYPFDNRQIAMVADIDADGFPDVIVKDDGQVNELYIFDGRDGSHKLTINAPASRQFNIGIAIADVDDDGFGEIILNTTEQGNDFAYKRRLICYEHNGVQKWLADKQTGSDALDAKLVPGIADFNGDGIPEVYVGDEIYNATTGAFIAAGGSAKGENSATAGEAFTTALDVLDSGACTDCAGLELVAGNIVYSVDISGASMTAEITAPVGIPDGFTAVADIDLDDDFDAVITSGGSVYIWDLQTSTQIGTTFNIADATAATSNTPAGGVANIGDFNGDGTIEIGLAGKNVYLVMDYNSGSNTLEELWSIYIKDGSGRTGSTLFDFEGDNANEVIYKAEQYLWVFDGTTGSIKAQVACGSGTRTDYPLVVDVDADGSTEIICSCSDNSGPGSANVGYVIAFEATDRPWVHARKIWNQFQYNITNINDDLSVPVNPQKGYLIGNRLNNYLTQAPILDEFGNYVIDAADLTLDILNVDVSSCGTTQISVTVTVGNQGNDAAVANTPISFYEEDPTGLSNFIGTGYTTTEIASGDSETITITLNVSAQPSEFNLYGVVNSNLTSTPFSYAVDFPAGPVAECNYTNNTDNTTTGCCGVSDAGEIAGFEQNCSSYDPVEITSIDTGGDVCASSSVYNGTGTATTDRLDYDTQLSGLSAANSDFTFEFWVRPVDVTTNSNFIILKSDNTSTDTRFMILPDEGLRVRTQGTNYNSDGLLTIGDWHHVAATYTFDTIRIYIDGALEKMFTEVGTNGSDLHNRIEIGKKQVGELDNFKIYNKKLTDAEIALAKDNCNYSNDGSLIHWWNFDTNSGTDDAIDLVGDADLTFRSGTTSTRTSPGGTLPNGGTVTYEWQYADDLTGPWNSISSSNAETYDPTSITATTYYRRAIINGGTCEDSYSNIVEKRIGTGLDDSGTITGNEEACSGYDAAEITESVAPGYSSSIEPTKSYQWQSAADIAGTWSDIGGATSITYDPGAIANTTYFRRVVSESGCSEQYISNVIEKKVISSTFYDAGSISGDEAACPGYTPSTITGTNPSGTYNFIYQWQSSSDGENFSDIAGETNADLSFSITLSNTMYYRRQISESGCTVYNTSNIVTKLVKTDITNAGILASDESQCGAFDPALITSSGITGGGPSYIYIWESTDSPDNAWSTVGGATSSSYNPPAITSSMFYRMGVRTDAVACTEYVYTDPISKEIFDSEIDENEIAGDEFECGAFDPTEITDEESPESDVDFQWEFTTDLLGSWTEISGATTATYDPTTISQTTYYRRKVRETGCTTWQEPAEYVIKDMDCQCGSGAIVLPGSNSTKIATDTCSNGDWSYYFDPANPGELLFGIEHYPTGGNTNQVDATITIRTTESLTGTTTYADSVFFREDIGEEEAIYVMGRYWNVDLNSGALNGAVNIRFFYSERESDRIEGLAEAWKENSPTVPSSYTTSGLTWFKTIGTTFDPTRQIETTGLNVNYTEITPAEYGFVNGVKYVQFDGITSFSGGTAGVRVGLNPIFPVDLIDFSGKSEGMINSLNWTTASEQNTDYFLLERLDENQEFLSISPEISARGSEGIITNYVFDDLHPLLNQDNYYRLKIVDLDGSFEYSKVLVLRNEYENKEVYLDVFPNPAKDIVNFEYSSPFDQLVKIRLLDVHGKLFYNESQSVEQNILMKGRFNLQHLAPGIYFLQVVEPNKVVSKKLIVH